MPLAFAILAALTLVSAVAALSFRSLVHCALSLAVTFAGLAALYLQLGAPFVGWAQILVYIGAVAVLIVFAILLTRSGEPTPQPVISRSWIVGIAVAVLVFGVLARGSSFQPGRPPRTARQAGAHRPRNWNPIDDPLCAAAGDDWIVVDGCRHWGSHHRHA